MICDIVQQISVCERDDSCTNHCPIMRKIANYVHA